MNAATESGPIEVSDAEHRTDELPTRVRTVLDRAAGLVDAGQGFDAVRLLVEASREEPHPELQRVLVLTRHAALDDFEAGPGLETWPRTMPDPFPGLVGPPEIDTSELTGDVLGGALVNHGSLIVRNLIPRDEAESLATRIDRVFTACDARNQGTPLSETAPWFVPFNPRPDYQITVGERWWTRSGGGVWTADSPRLMFEVLDLFERAGLRQVLTDYLGEEPGVSVKKCTLRRVPVDTGTDWHQDGAFLGSDIRTVNVWLALTHCGDDAPGLDVLPRRVDLLETGTEGAQFDWSVGPGVVEREAAACGVVRPIFEPGDAFLFDERHLHRTGVSPGMTEERYAIETWFFAPSHYPHAQVPIAF